MRRRPLNRPRQRRLKPPPPAQPPQAAPPQAAPPAAASSPTAPPAAKPSAIPLTADSLGAQLVLMVSEQVRDVSSQIADLAHTLTHFKAFYYWFLRTANDPYATNLLFGTAWKLALVFACAFSAEFLAFRLIKRPVAALEARVPQVGTAPALAMPVDPPSSVADVIAEPARHQRRLSLARAWQSVLRLPFVVGRLVLELLPVIVFVGVATA